MAIINCPSCNQKISDKAKICNNCQFDLVKKSSVSGVPEEKLRNEQRLKRIKKKYSLQMQSMIGIILILLGSSLWYFDGQGFVTKADFMQLTTIAVGAFWYLITRVRLLVFKKG